MVARYENDVTAPRVHQLRISDYIALPPSFMVLLFI